jgi:hypothetical protein
MRPASEGVDDDSTTRKLLIAFGVLLVVTLSFSVLMGGMMAPGFMTSADPAGQGPFGLGTMRGPGWMWGLGMGFGGLVMLAFWGVVVVGVILLIRSIGGFPAGPGPKHRSMCSSGVMRQGNSPGNSMSRCVRTSNRG